MLDHQDRVQPWIPFPQRELGCTVAQWFWMGIRMYQTDWLIIKGFEPRVCQSKLAIRKPSKKLKKWNFHYINPRGKFILSPQEKGLSLVWMTVLDWFHTKRPIQNTWVIVEPTLFWSLLGPRSMVQSLNASIRPSRDDQRLFLLHHPGLAHLKGSDATQDSL